MFQFLQPILLLSATAIAIPVIIHLWNIKQGKTLKIGSIALLTQGSKQSARSFKLTDLLLLFLRCLLITLLALLIAGPVWKQEITAKKEKGWVLLEKESLHEAYNNNKSIIDSLVKAGFEFHYFDASFTKDNLEEALKFTKDTMVPGKASYWTLLSRLNEEIPASLPVYLFTANHLKRFGGDRPQLSLNLHWKTYLSRDSVISWPEQAFLASADSIRLLIGHSKPSGTFYTNRNLSPSQVSGAEYAVDVTGGKLMVSKKGSVQEKNAQNNSNIEVDTSTIRITVFTDKYNSDAAYVRAAIQSTRSFSKRKLQLFSTNNVSAIPARQDWIFWLSDQTIPSSASAKNIFKYEYGKVENIHSWIILGDLPAVNQEAVSISKAITNNASNNLFKAIWEDGYGNTILSREVKQHTTIFHFYSRLDPEWTDLPWSEEFPKLLLQLILHNENEQPEEDKRVVDERQIQPALAKSTVTGKNKFNKTTDLAHILWLASFVVFFIERLLSFNTKRGVRSE